MNHWKVVTHNRRPAVQGGAPLWTGDLPAELPTVEVDESEQECGAGWNCTTDLATAFRIAGLWPDGRSSLALVVEPHGTVVMRGDKTRASDMTILREATEDEVAAAIRRLSEPFGPLADDMAAEQIAWRAALARPHHDPGTVERGLRDALAARGLAWTLEEHPNARAAWAAWAAWAALPC